MSSACCRILTSSVGVVTILPGKPCEYLFLTSYRVARGRGTGARPGSRSRRTHEETIPHPAPASAICARVGTVSRGGELQLEEEVVRREDEAVHQRDRGLCGRSENKPSQRPDLHTRFGVQHCPRHASICTAGRRPRTSGEVMPLYRPTKRSSRTIVAIAPNVVSYFPAIAGLWNRTLTAPRSLGRQRRLLRYK